MTAKRHHLIAQNPNDNLWYVLGFEGKYWMPISEGFKTRREAEQSARRITLAEQSQLQELRQWNGK